MKKFRTIFFTAFISFFLVACTTTHYKLEFDNTYNVSSKEKKTVILKEGSVYSDYDYNVCDMKENDLITYVCGYRSENSEYIVKAKKGNFIAHDEISALTLSTIFSLGIIPSYETDEYVLELEIYNKYLNIGLKKEIGTIKRTRWYGWIPLFIPSGDEGDAYRSETEDLTGNIAHLIYGEDSAFEKERKQLIKQKKKLEKEQEEAKENQKNMLERFKSRGKNR